VPLCDRVLLVGVGSTSSPQLILHFWQLSTSPVTSIFNLELRSCHPSNWRSVAPVRREVPSSTVSTSGNI